MTTTISTVSGQGLATSLPLLLAAPSINGKKVTLLNKPSPEGAIDFIQSIITSNHDPKEPFYVLDLAVVVDLYNKWVQRMANVRPFYAVKCNPDPALLGALSALGASFDCASRAEMEDVLALGVAPERIVYANPCKMESHIKFAAAAGVDLTTFDSVHELDKLQKHHPRCSLLLRLKAPDETGARRPLGTKYGALPEEVVPLLRAARAASLSVVGVSFHVGGGATNLATYRTAVAYARAAFDAADNVGGPRMQVLDIGGGFSAGAAFDEAAEIIKAAIDTFFGDRRDVRVIAEPGRLFAETAFTLATSVMGKRVRGLVREYWITDGIYGSMSCIKNNTANVAVMPLAVETDPANARCKGRETYDSTVFGPTCDALDKVLTGVRLPELGVGDWLVSPNMGAYTASMGSNFNGFATIPVRLAFSNHTRAE